MEIKKSKSPFTRKRVIIAAVIIVIIAASSAAAYFFAVKPTETSTPDDSSVNYSEASDGQKKAGEQIKENSVNPDDASKPNTSGSDQSEPPVASDNGKSTVNATMTAANQNGSLLQIRFDISAVTSAGTCTLTLKKGSSTVTKTAGVQALAGSSTCKGFDVQTSELSSGTWQLSLHFENDNFVADTTGTAVIK